MKILLTGSFKSGKTTLANLLRRQGFPIIDEFATTMLEQAQRRGDLTLKQRPEFQQMLLSEQLRAEQEAERRYPTFVCDRGAYDIITYSRYYKHEFDWYSLLQNHKPYNLIFLCTIDGIDVGNQFSAEDLIKRKELQQGFFDTLDNLCVPYRVLTGTPEERLATVDREIQIYRSNIEGSRRRRLEIN